MERVKHIMKSPYIIAVLFAFKMMIYYNLIEVNRMELILLVISMLVWGMIFICFSSSGLKRKRGIFLLVYSLLSILMFADTMYYNYYNQTVSIKQIWQAKSVAAVPKSFFATLIPASFLLFVDIPIVYYHFKKISVKIGHTKWYMQRKLRYAFFMFSGLIVAIVANPFHTDAFEKVNRVEFFTNHINDIYETIADRIVTEEMEEAEILEVLENVSDAPSQLRHHGIGKDKNLVVIQLEAFQDFVIHEEYNGQEITPNLNRLIQSDSFYFENYFFNMGKGNTADAEFTSMNSLYPSIDGESYRLYEENTFRGLPWLLRDKGYGSFVVHGYKGEFWNRENAYPNQGFEDYISMEDLEQDEMIGMGISDGSVFRQLVPILKDQERPFFSFVITLTNHHPFVLDEQYQTLQLKEEDKDTKFGAYLQTVRYTDEVIGQFIADLKEEGLYENTVIALYGDHHGLNSGMEDVNEQMSEFIGRPYDYDEMLNIPLIIHVPGSDVAETISTSGGQIDFMPTIANIMGIDLDQENPFILGQDLMNAKEGFVAFTAYLFEGSFVKDDVMFQVSREGIFDGSRAWRIGTTESLDPSMYQEAYDRAILLKKTSKEILEQDLINKHLNDLELGIE